MPAREPAEKSTDAILLENLPQDGVVCDHEARAMRLSQITGKSIA
jgi:hypothetical protein